MARIVNTGGGRPFGDIYSAATPHLDQLSNQLYVEQKTRESQQQSASNLLDEEFSKNLASVRTADINKVTNAYDNFKQKRMATINKHNVSPQDQMGVLQAKADLYKTIDGSKQKLQQEKFAADKVKKNPNDYVDNAYATIMRGMQTPYDQPLTISGADGKPQQIDWTNPDEFARHVDTKSVMDAMKFAAGTFNKPTSDINDRYKINPTDLQYQQPSVSTKNNAFTYYNNMMLAATKSPQDFSGTLPHPTQEQYFNTLQQFNQLDPKIKKNWKMTDDLPDDNNINSELQRQIKYNAMTYAINPQNQPQVTVKPVTDITAKTNRSDALRTSIHNDSENQSNQRQQNSFNHTDKKQNEAAAATSGLVDNIINATKSNDKTQIQTALKPLFAATKGILDPATSSIQTSNDPKNPNYNNPTLTFQVKESVPVTDPNTGTTKNQERIVPHTLQANDPLLKEKLMQISGQIYKGTTQANMKSIIGGSSVNGTSKSNSKIVNVQVNGKTFQVPQEKFGAMKTEMDKRKVQYKIQ